MGRVPYLHIIKIPYTEPQNTRVTTKQPTLWLSTQNTTTFHKKQQENTTRKHPLFASRELISRKIPLVPLLMVSSIIKHLSSARTLHYISPSRAKFVCGDTPSRVFPPRVLTITRNETVHVITRAASLSARAAINSKPRGSRSWRFSS